MQLPVEISYRGVEKSPEIDDLIRAKAARLDRFCDHISRCDIAVEQPNQSQREGNPFRVRIDVTVPPGHELVADEKQIEHDMHEPLTKIINDAFKTMERQLKDLVEKQRHEVKTHVEPRALITKLFGDYHHRRRRDGYLLPSQRGGAQHLRGIEGGGRGAIRPLARRDGTAGEHGACDQHRRAEAVAAEERRRLGTRAR
jgi:ribosomal subunit interface protein